MKGKELPNESDNNAPDFISGALESAVNLLAHPIESLQNLIQSLVESAQRVDIKVLVPQIRMKLGIILRDLLELREKPSHRNSGPSSSDDYDEE